LGNSVNAVPETDKESHVKDSKNGILVDTAMVEELQRLKVELEALQQDRVSLRQESDKLRAALAGTEASTAEIIRSKDIMEAKVLVSQQKAAEIERNCSSLQS
jgi:regulator of replication initiation timing